MHTSSKNSTKNSGDRSFAYLVLTLITIGSWIAVALFPEGRTWGFAPWAWVPRVPALGVLGVVAAAAVALHLWLKGSEPDEGETHGTNRGERGKAWLLAGLVMVTAIIFWLARAQVHFLGDGYTALSLLANDSPLVKTREIGESLLHVWVKKLSGQEGQEGALFSFQALSILAGATFSLFAGWTAVRLFTHRWQRGLFIAGLLTGGYMLLFFGYVENYSLFVMSVGGYVLTGLLIARGLLRPWWLLVSLAAAIFFHALGIVLIPSAGYLILSPTRLGRRMRTWTAGTWATVAFPFVAALAGLSLWAWKSSVFFQYSVIPLFRSQFTVAGYTLLSPAHLMDFVNLGFLLLPGTALLVALVVRTILLRRSFTREEIFLATMAASALGAAFVLDPKLGMPRDWDLFSFAGMPLAVGFYYLALSGSTGSPHGKKIAALGILLAVTALSGQVLTQTDERYALSRLRYHMSLDPVRMGSVYHILRDRAENKGNNAAADSINAEWQRKHPEAVLTTRADGLIQAGKYDEALVLALQAIEINPAHWNGYSGAGTCYLYTQRYDSALVYLRIADGINPYNPKVIHNLAYCYDRRGDWRKAERLWQKAFRIDTMQTASLLELCRIYQIHRKPDKLLATLERLAAQANPPPEALAKLADVYAEADRYPEAGEVFRRAVLLGLDSTVMRQRLAARPRLRSYMPESKQ